MRELAHNAKIASKQLMIIKNETRVKILAEMADALAKRKNDIIAENKKDIKNALEADLNKAMIDRLTLDSARIDQMVDGVRAILKQPEVVGLFYGEFKNENGLIIKKQRIPLGVILMIFESRPNVVVDCAALAIKSSNAIILKGGKEAKFSNEILGEIIQDSIAKYIPRESVQVLASDNRSVINELLALDEFIDVVIPRGGHQLIEYVAAHAKMPVIAHYQGLCHMYLDEYADVDQAIKLVVNAKTQRPGVCNAIETLLIHRKILEQIGPKLVDALEQQGTELRVDDIFGQSVKGQFKVANEKDWSTEYLDNILAIKTVSSLDEAISHIDKYGSHHTECIVSQNQSNYEKFLSEVDASCVVINASTRFNDGGQLGLGAELGISTTKIHAYGPMGAEQMTTSRYVVIGEGQIRQ